jgi:hypothetical protein
MPSCVGTRPQLYGSSVSLLSGQKNEENVRTRKKRRRFCMALALIGRRNHVNSHEFSTEARPSPLATTGNTYHQRTGRVPRRPTGYDWSRPVPGDTAATLWEGVHETCELVQIVNPLTGWMQNCNIALDTMTEDSPMTADLW